MKLLIDRDGGTSEALKLKLDLNSRVNKRDIFNDISHKRGIFFLASPKKIVPPPLLIDMFV